MIPLLESRDITVYGFENEVVGSMFLVHKSGLIDEVLYLLLKFC